MRIARIVTPDGPATVRLEGEEWVELTATGPDGELATEPEADARRFAVAGAHLLAPCEPRVVLGMFHNSGPEDRLLPPQAFHKSARTVVGPGAPIRLDPSKGEVKAEAELAVVIGRTSRHLRAEEVEDAILGWTVGNDVTLVGQSAHDHLLTQVKNGDGFTPLGPWIETDLGPLLDGEAAGLATEVPARGVGVSSTSAGLAWTVREVLVYVTEHLELGPGDVVLTGAPATSLDILVGDEVTVSVAGLGRLTNPVVAAGDA